MAGWTVGDGRAAVGEGLLLTSSGELATAQPVATVPAALPLFAGTPNVHGTSRFNMAARKILLATRQPDLA